MSIEPPEQTTESDIADVEHEAWTGAQRHIRVMVDDDREPVSSAVDVFAHTFVSTLHKWVVGGVVLLLGTLFLSLLGFW